MSLTKYEVKDSDRDQYAYAAWLIIALGVCIILVVV